MGFRIGTGTGTGTGTGYRVQGREKVEKRKGREEDKKSRK